MRFQRVFIQKLKPKSNARNIILYLPKIRNNKNKLKLRSNEMNRVK